jgi:hypothetical protein
VVPYPNDAYYDRYNVLDMATNIENLAFQIYSIAQNELRDSTDWNLETLSELYDVTTAAQYYLNAVEVSPNIFVTTIDQLFSLEDIVNRAGNRVICGNVSRQLRDNFNLLKYFVQELLWQYRLDPAYGGLRSDFSARMSIGPALPQTALATVSHWAESTSVPMQALNDGTNFETLSCHLSSFGTTGGSTETFEVISNMNDQTLSADNLQIIVQSDIRYSSRSALGAITALVVKYADGTQDDLIDEARYYNDRHYSDGRLIVGEYEDPLLLGVNPQKSVESIFVMAMSYDSAQPLRLAFALNSNP